MDWEGLDATRGEGEGASLGRWVGFWPPELEMENTFGVESVPPEER